VEQTRADKLLDYFDCIVAAYKQYRPPVFQDELTEDLRRLLLTYYSDLDEAFEQGTFE
jgi:hypothetical protein